MTTTLKTVLLAGALVAFGTGAYAFALLPSVQVPMTTLDFNAQTCADPEVLGALPGLMRRVLLDVLHVVLPSNLNTKHLSDEQLANLVTFEVSEPLATAIDFGIQRVNCRVMIQVDTTTDDEMLSDLGFANKTRAPIAYFVQNTSDSQRIEICDRVCEPIN